MSYFIDDNIIEKIKDSSNIVDIVSDYIRLKKTGSNYVGLCPFHNERTPSFTVSDTKQFFHCFGCGESGDSIGFIMKKENLDFPEAVKFLADKLGIVIEEGNKDDKYLEGKNRAYEINKEAARFFYGNLTKNPEILNYLNRRDVKDREIRRFGLGYALDSWDSLKNFLVNKGYKEEELEKIGLLGRKRDNSGYYDRFRNRIIFPIIDTKGRIIGFGGRVLDDSKPKYLNSKETIVFSKGNNLYGLNLVKKNSDRKRILLVEGYMDVIALSGKGIDYSVASLGTALTPDQGRLLKRYGEEVYIAFDSDTAGINASLKAIDILYREEIRPRVIVLPKDMDPDDYINKFGLIKFEGLFREAMEDIDYKIFIKKMEFDLNDTSDKIKFTLEIANVIKDLKSSIEQDVYIRKISKDTGISMEAIREEINSSKYNEKKWVKTYQRQDNKKIDINPMDTEIVSGYIKAELDLIKLMIYHRDYYDSIKNKISVEEFYSRDGQILYEIVHGLYAEHDTIKTEDIKKKINLLEDGNKDILDSVGNIEFYYEPTKMDEILNDLINTVIHSNLERHRRKIIEEIKNMEKQADKTEEDNVHFKDLFLELTKLNNEIKLMVDE